MMKKSVFVLICLLLASSLPDDVHAKSYAWLIATDGSAYKLDVDANKILNKVELKSTPRISDTLLEIGEAVVGDAMSKIIYMIYDYPCRYCGQGVKIYSLTDLSLRKDLGITSDEPDGGLPKIIAPLSGNKFYVIWWDKSIAVDGNGGETYSVYDKTTLNRISDLTSFPLVLRSINN